MRRSATKRGAVGLMALALAAGGCGPADTESPLSPTATTDPGLFEKAKAEADEAARKARAAEAKALKGAIQVEQP